jgi:hypothetical protein
MNRIALIVMTALLVAALATAASAAQETVIYAGDLKASPSGLALGSWGSGTLTQVSEVQFQAGSVLKLTTQGYFQGGRMDFQTPLDISSFASQPNAYIEMQLRPFYAKSQPKPAETATATTATRATAMGRAVGTTAGAMRAGVGFGSRRTSGMAGAIAGSRMSSATTGAQGFGAGSRSRTYGAGVTGGTGGTIRRGRYLVGGPSGAYGASGYSPGAYGATGYGAPGYGVGGAYGAGRYAGGGAYGRGGYAQGGYGAAGYGARGAYGAPGAYGAQGAYGATTPYGRTGVGGFGRSGGAIGAAGQYGRGGYVVRRPQKTAATQSGAATTTETTTEQTAPAPPSEAAFRADSFRIEITTDKGTAVLPAYAIYPGNSDAPGWVRVGFPLGQFKGAIGDKLSRITIFGDRPDTVYIGEVKLALETSQLEARPAAYPANAKVGEPVTFLANARAGLSPIEAVWDFGQASGGQPPVAGDRVVNVFNQPGDYEVRVTVSDTAAANPEHRTFAVLVRVR